MHRRSDWILPRYRDDDVFIGGGEDLVLSLEPNAGAWVNGSRDAGTHVVQCFRPRVESTYDRVELWRRKSDGDMHWRVRTSDGLTHVYGEDASSRIADPADARRVYPWLCERTYDPPGQLISYSYRSEDLANVMAAPWERNRQPVNTLIDRILYGVHQPYYPTAPAPPNRAAYLFDVVFDYGSLNPSPTRPTPPPAPPPTSPVPPN